MAGENDSIIEELRGQISATDRMVVEAINRRLELVTQLKRHKDARGLPFLDPERERSLLAELARANRGPLSEDGLQALVREILDLTKRELGRGDR